MASLFFCSCLWLLQAAGQQGQKPTKQSGTLSVPGFYLRAFLVAHAAFTADKHLPQTKKRLENYSIEFSHTTNHYYVFFRPKASVSGRFDGGSNEFGTYVRYRVKRKNFKVDQVTGYR